MILFSGNIYSQPKYQSKKSPYPQVTLSGIGGISFPVGNFGENFNSGPTFGLELSYKANREVGFYGDLGYSSYPSKTDNAAPDGKYIQYTAGPRYYFTSPNLKSSIFLEAGIGGYSFMQNAYESNGAEIAEYSTTNFGINGGIGGNLNLGRDIDMIFKAKYHNILTSGGSQSFIEPVLGITVGF